MQGSKQKQKKKDKLRIDQKENKQKFTNKLNDQEQIFDQ